MSTKSRKRKQPIKKDSENVPADKVYDSEDLDKSDIERPVKSKKALQSTRKKRKLNLDEIELEDGQEVVGVVVQAPTTGLVPAGQISRNTLDFLSNLKDLKCNNRTWFKLHEPLYRAAEQEWKGFIEVFTGLVTDVDPQLPHLPPKDVIHRIYRDVRFSNDKTPYKSNLSASFSRSGRKGIFAGYHISISSGGSLIAAGSWSPERNELATLRSNIQRSSRRLRDIISSSDFVSHFGDAKPHPNGARQNIFGGEDELKTAPKGVNKDHEDIDLLRCRSFAVVYRFNDEEVLTPDFKNKLVDVAKVVQPFVHCLNDMLTIQGGDGDDDNDDSEVDDE